MSVGSDPRRGSEIAGYLLEDLLGRGGMGTVYRATDLGLGRKVALKLLAPELAENTRFRDRFLRESQLAASLDHPNIVPIYAAGETDGQLYLAMRFVEGYDLRQLLARAGALEPGRALGLLEQVADALDAAHDGGLIHRDVKPGNVLIAERSGREHCYLADFGLTKQASSISGLTGTGELVGTVAYVSPEQIRGEAVDRRADVYALGCMLYECLSGEQPFARDSDVATLWAHVNERPAELAAARPELGGEIDHVLARALAKAPADRQESCGELIASARAALGVQVATAPAVPRRRARRLPRRRVLLAIAVAILVAAAVPIVVLLRGGEDAMRLGPMSVGVIDPSSNKLVADIPLGFTSPLIAAGAGSIWVIDPDGSTLTKIDPETKAIVPPTRAIQREGDPIGLAVGHGSVWIALNQGLRLVVLEIGPEFGDVRRTIPIHESETPLPGGRETVALAVGEGAVWALENGRGQITRINPATGTPKVLEDGFDSGSLAVGGGAVWIGGGTEVTKLDPETGIALATAPVQNVSQSQTRSIVFGGGAVWFAANTQPSLAEIALSGALVDSQDVPDLPTALAVDDRRVWVASAAGRSVSRLDPESHEVETTDLGAPPAGIVAAFGAVWTSPGEAVS